MKASLKIVVLGAGSQLSSAFQKILSGDTNWLFFSKTECDITQYESILQLFQKHRPDVLVNTAAYTRVDQAESEPEAALQVNSQATGTLAEICKIWGCKLIHFSTDYVFDGTATVPYTETDQTNPQTIYGRSKRAGEEAVITSKLKEYAIIRTSWLYSEFGNNFYKTMLRLAETHTEIKVVNDQTGCPTYAPDLARAVVQLIPALTENTSGIYHFCNRGVTTWHDFAKSIFQARKLPVLVLPISTAQYPTSAKRPMYSVLDTRKITEVFKVEIPFWKDRLVF